MIVTFWSSPGFQPLSDQWNGDPLLSLLMECDGEKMNTNGLA